MFHAFDTDSATPDGSVRVHVVVTWKELDLGTPAPVSEEKAPVATSNIKSAFPVATSRPGLSNPVNVGAMPYNSSNTSIQHLLRKPQELSEKLPVVNEKYGIQQFYTLALTP